MRHLLRLLPGTEDGQTMAEYALILGFIAAVCVAALTLMGLGISGFLNDFASEIP